MIPDGLAAAPTLDGVLLRVPAPGILRLYRLDDHGAAGRYGPEWGASVPGRQGWIPAACIQAQGPRVLVLEDDHGMRAWRLPWVRLGRRGPLTEPLLRAALVMRSGWPEEAWVARASTAASAEGAAMARSLVASGCAPHIRELVAAVALRAPAREAQALAFASALAALIGHPTPSTDALLTRLAESMGEAPPLRCGPPVVERLGLPRDWRQRSRTGLRGPWRTAAFAAHPDQGGDAERFREVQAAWRVVCDDLERVERLTHVPTPPTPTLRALWGQETGLWRVLRRVPMEMVPERCQPRH